MADKWNIENSNLTISEHSGKMEYIPSLSTNPLCNNNCKENRKIDGSVCQKCYSVNRSIKQYNILNNTLIENSNILSKKVYSKKSFPKVNNAFFRFESFGDIININHLENLINISKQNKHCKFALWTKQIKLVENYFDNNPKPKNLILIYSSLFLNKEIDIKNFNHCDKIFTVYTKDFIENNDVKINCGAKSCMNCLKCYTKNKTKYIKEKKK